MHLAYDGDLIFAKHLSTAAPTAATSSTRGAGRSRIRVLAPGAPRDGPRATADEALHVSTAFGAEFNRFI